MKHLPNTLTLANLFFGCVAIAFILNAPTYLDTVTGEVFYPVMGMAQIYWGGVFIGIAALMDVLDGLSARLLKVESALGKELDSLADIVSFGVAPAMILFKFIWWSYMSEPGALETPMLVMAPAFLIPCFGALRLARYNQRAQEQQYFFRGLPIPAVGILIASLPVMFWFPAVWDITGFLRSRWLLYLLVGVLCFLMVSNIKFLKWKAAGKGLAAWWPQILLAVCLIIGFPFLKFGVVPFVFVLYILVSLVYPHPKTPEQHGEQVV